MTDVTSARPEVQRGEPSTEAQLDRHRGELIGYCYRMLGSVHDAEDAVQETMVRAWRGMDGFGGRASLRTWLYRIATNVCLDSLNGRNRRAMPMDLSSPGPPVMSALKEPTAAEAWVEPVPDRLVAPEHDPADVAVERDSVRLAFVSALQALPPRQRAVLILREVLRWHADEVATLLDTTVASVNSALQRARATMSAREGEPRTLDPVDDAQRALVDRYVAAFEAYDMERLVALLHEDAVQSMPPLELWLQGRDDVLAWFVGPGNGCRGSRCVPAGYANGAPAFGQYKPNAAGDGYEPWSLMVVEVGEGRVDRLTFFLDTARIFPVFGLPLEYPGD